MIKTMHKLRVFLAKNENEASTLYLSRGEATELFGFLETMRKDASSVAQGATKAKNAATRITEGLSK